MEKANKKSSLKPKLQKATAKVASTLHGNAGKDLKIIAVTGSTGKDIVANFLHKILVQNHVPTALITSPTASPLTALALHRYLSKSLKNGATHVVIEAPAAVLEKFIFHELPIHMAVLTNTTSSPKDPLSQTPSATITHKSTIFENSPHFIVLNRDDHHYDHFSTYPAKITTTTYGRHKDSTVRIERSKLYKKGTEASLAIGPSPIDVATFISGEDAVAFMAAAAAAATILDIPATAIIDGIASYEPQP